VIFKHTEHTPLEVEDLISKTHSICLLWKTFSFQQRGGTEQSGYGQESAYPGIREFVNRKTVWIA